MYNQIREDTLYIIFYTVVTSMALMASFYLLFRRANAIAPDITPPVRLRRWAAAFYKEQTQLCVFHTRLQQSDWHDTESTEIPLRGLTLNEVWENIVAVIGGLDAQAEKTIEEQIIHREQREKLLRQIEALEKRARTEKQTRKKYELHQQIIKLKKELAE